MSELDKAGATRVVAGNQNISPHVAVAFLESERPITVSNGNNCHPSLHFGYHMHTFEMIDGLEEVKLRGKKCLQPTRF